MRSLPLLFLALSLFACEEEGDGGGDSGARADASVGAETDSAGGSLEDAARSAREDATPAAPRDAGNSSQNDAGNLSRNDGGNPPQNDAAGPPPRDAGGPGLEDAGAAGEEDGGAPSPRDAGPEPDVAVAVDGGPAPDPPVACEPACEGGAVCVAGQCGQRITGVAELDAVLFADEQRYNTEILKTQDPDLSWRPSTVYKWRDFLQAVAAMYSPGVGELRLWLGDADAEGQIRARYALVNLAAFLAQSMKETIKYDACDENNWDNTNNYQISNACGQLGQRYEDYDCEMACPRDPTMTQSAVTNAVWWGAPGPFFCAPDAVLAEAGLLTADGRTGYWNVSSDCWPYPATEEGFTPAEGPVYTRPQCEVYTGQKAGSWEWDGSGGSVEGCCWWGRGVIQTTGRCNFGVLNHYLGQSHLDPALHAPPANALYPELNFCRDPGLICASAEHPELKWIAGLFYWMSSVQTYERDGWQYLIALRAYVDGGMQGNAFIDAVSGIVNRGCHNPPCESGPVDGVDDRRANFEAVLTVMGLR